MCPNLWRCELVDSNESEVGMVLTHFIVSDDVERSRKFYTEVLGGAEVLAQRRPMSHSPTASSSSMLAEARLTISQP